LFTSWGIAVRPWGAAVDALHRLTQAYPTWQCSPVDDSWLRTKPAQKRAWKAMILEESPILG
jgi:hypothetical protein